MQDDPSTTSGESASARASEVSGLLDITLANVREAVAGLRFGNVSLTVHEGRVVQIDVTEKRRLVSG